MKKTIALLLSVLLIFTAFPAVSFAAEGFAVTELRVNSEVSPRLADGENISFSWQMKAENIGSKQTAYEIALYKYDVITDTADTEIWNSGKVSSDKSVGIEYEGSLEENGKYAWTVTVWNENGVPVTSEMSRFETAPSSDFFDSAKWVGAAESDKAPILRGEYTAQDKEIAYAAVYATSVGVFDLFIGGRRVGETTRDGVIYDEMKPGWSDYTKRILYYSYDITSYLESGKTNGFSAMLGEGWALGKISRDYYGFTKPAFIMKAEIIYADGTTDYFVTDGQWKYSLESAVTESDIYDGEAYNANLYDGTEVSENSFDASLWQNVSTDITYQGELTAHSGNTVRVRDDLERSAEKITVYEGIKDNGSDYGEINTVSEKSSFSEFTLKKGQTAIFDLGQNITGWQEISLKAPQNTEVKFDYAEMLNDSGLLSRKNDGPKGSLYTENYRSAKADGRYISSGEGEETYYSRFTFYGFRYVSVTASDDITITAFKGKVVSSVEKETGSIETSDESVNQLFSNILWSQRGNYLSIPTDCPQRDEKLGWTGDAQIFIGTAAYNADVQSFMHKWLSDMCDSQGDDGRYTDVAPYIPIVGKGNAAWGDAGIIIPYNLYLMYGDKRIIEDMYASMEKYMSYLATRGYKGANVTYGDWLSYESNDTAVRELIASAYYAYDTLLMAEMSEAIGKSSEAAYYRSLHGEIKNYFRSTFMKKGELKENCRTQTCYLMALKTEMFDGEEEKLRMIYSLCNNIAANGNRLATGFVGTADLNEILSDYGKSGLAYTLLLQRDNPSWLYSVDQGATTVWERWNSYTFESGFYEASMNSYNHYSYGAVAEWMYSDMLGINADSENPGFKNVIFRFNPDMREDGEIPSDEKRITFAKGEYDSAYGTVKSAWENTDSGFRYDITVPANTTATVYIPTDHSSLYVGGKTASSLTLGTDGVKYLGTQEGYAKFETVSGSFTFEAKKQSNVSHSFTSTVIEADCTRTGYIVSECDCGYGYISQNLGITDHTDSGSDGKCDVCGYVIDPTAGCDCMCHKGGFMGFIYKIIRFFWKLFGTNKICECGIEHY